MSISLEALKEAISIKESIAALEARLEKIFGGVVSTVVEHVPLLQQKKARRKMSKAARAKIGAAQRARWAKTKGLAPAADVAKPAKKAKRKLSPEGRTRIVAALKKRWASKKK